MEILLKYAQPDLEQKANDFLVTFLGEGVLSERCELVCVQLLSPGFPQLEGKGETDTKIKAFY